MDVFGLPLRRLIVPLLLVACGEPEAEPLIERGRAYLESPSARRDALERSIVDPHNTYSADRLERYTEEAWGALPEWNPRVRRGDDLTALDLDVPFDEASLLALGERAFFAYPVQIRPELTIEDGDRYGLWPGAFVLVDAPDGEVAALTCATCHARPGRPGVPNHEFDLGLLLDDYYGSRTAQRTWGPGAVDVTADDRFNPTAIPDLRPIAAQTHLHRAATLVNDPIALAVRIETLLITSTTQNRRPPRIVALALAMYLWRMIDALPAWSTNATFERACARCHGDDGAPNGPVPIALVGTDDAVALSPERTTGRWRVPSLRGVGQRSRLLSNGAVEGLEALLDPERPVAGHAFGFELSVSERAALVRFLEAR